MNAFIKLKDYPDYYEIIKEPMDMKNISRKILSNSYTSLKEMESDLLLMLDNAKRYNDPKSIIYKDACKLKNLSKSLCKQIAALAGQAKFLDTTKTREKKKKTLEDIAQISDHDEFQKLLVRFDWGLLNCLHYSLNINLLYNVYYRKRILRIQSLRLKKRL